MDTLASALTAAIRSLVQEGVLHTSFEPKPGPEDLKPKEGEEEGSEPAQKSDLDKYTALLAHYKEVQLHAEGTI